MLYILATPIGNLQDLSSRAVDQLSSCDLILCEDMRHSRKLLDRFQIKKPLRAYHKFNEKLMTNQILPLLKEGKNLVLISDSGTPLIADPGSVLIQAMIEENLEMTSIPGPSSLMSALVLSGFDLKKFQFCGFVPKTNKASFITNLLTYPGVSLLFESNKRLISTLIEIDKLSPDRAVVVAKELTKKFETIYRGQAKKIISLLPPSPLGEYIIVIDRSQDETPFDAIPFEKHLTFLEEALSCSKKEAIKIAAKMRQENKSELYAKIFKK